MSVNFETLIASPDEWQLIHQGEKNTVYKTSDFAIKKYAEAASAEREFGVLQALRDFGINLAPEPLFLSKENAIVVMSWLEGQPMTTVPATDDETMWHRIMATVGASGQMPYGAYQKKVPSMGRGYFQPADMLNEIDQMVQKVGENHTLYEQFQHLMQRVRQHVTPEWSFPVKIGLCHRDHDLHNLIWDGHHLLAVDWENADWGDMAAEVGLWSAHPAYEEVPLSHWVWARWEFARLAHDENLVPRATVYARLGQVWWAVYLTLHEKDAKLRDRYFKRAEKFFA